MLNPQKCWSVVSLESCTGQTLVCFRSGPIKAVLKRVIERIEEWVAGPFNGGSSGKVLIFRPDAIGDFVLARPFIFAMAEHFKKQGKRVYFLGNSVWRDLSDSQDQTSFDEMHFFNRKAISAFGLKRFKLILWLKSQKFHTVIYPVYSREYKQGDRVVVLSRAPVRIGFRGDFTSISPDDKIRGDDYYTQLIESDTEFSFEFERNRFFAQKIMKQDLGDLRPRLPFSSRAKTQIRPIIGIFVGGQEKKRLWCVDRFAGLIKMILEKTSLSVELLGGVDCAEMGATIDQEFSSHSRVTNLIGKTTLKELAERIQSAQVLVTHDSGAYHIAVALGCPVVCISNGNHWGRFVPYPENLLSAAQAIVFPPNMNIEDKSLFYSSSLSIQTITVEHVFKDLAQMLR